MKRLLQFVARGFAGFSVFSWAIGKSLNQIVMYANDGLMPVKGPAICTLFPGAQLDQIHVCADATAHHLLWLSDFIIVGGHSVWSPGDFVIQAGSYVVIPAAILLAASFLSRFVK